jgi:hypothetical protein
VPDSSRSIAAAEGPVCWLHYLPALRQANFPSSCWEEVIDDLDYHIGFFCSRPEIQRYGEVAAELLVVLDRSKALLAELENLSHRARCAILDAKRYALPGVIQDPWELKRSLQELVVRATKAGTRVPADSGGRPSIDAFRNLLLSLGICWRVKSPDGKGIRKSEDCYRGPLREFVLSVLRGAPERFGAMSHPSEQQIERELFAMRQRIDTVAARELLFRTVEESRGAQRVLIRQAP